ncbi:Uncharacterised protein [Burkholderia pseudomallei]|nr:Uncharacterised protein [Burkholderia pseudomallei]
MWFSRRPNSVEWRKGRCPSIEGKPTVDCALVKGLPVFIVPREDGHWDYFVYGCQRNTAETWDDAARLVTEDAQSQRNYHLDQEEFDALIGST